MRQDTLLEVAKSAKLSRTAQGACRTLDPCGPSAAENDDYETANRLLDVALAAARRARDGALVKRIVGLNKEIDEIEKAHAQLQPALAVLKQNATDPEANLAVGRFLCLIRGHWDKGIPMLALGSDDALKALATTGTRGGSTRPTRRWPWPTVGGNFPSRRPGKSKNSFRSWRPAHYKRVLPDLSA